MTDDVDRASEREAELLADALRDQELRAGLKGKTAADSAAFCADCGQDIPLGRRIAMPGCQLCVPCKGRQEKSASTWSAAHQTNKSAMRRYP